MDKIIYIRDDDVCTLNKKFIEFHRAIIDNGFPVVYAVIPNKTEDSIVKFLKKEMNKHPGMISITQHGWKHQNYSNNSQKFEFGFSRNYEQQKSDILTGFKIMQSKFANYFTPIFVPPYHAFDKNTIRVLREGGISGISSTFSLDFLAQGNDNLLYIPVNLTMNLYVGDNVSMRTTKNMLERFLVLYKTKKVIGICIHHETLTKQELARFIRFLKFIRKRYQDISFVNFDRFMVLSDFYKKFAKNKPKVQDVCFEITNKCNLRCRMCSIWSEKIKCELSYEKIKEFLESNFIDSSLSFVSLTGGEIFLHPEISRIYSLLLSLKRKGRIYGIVLNTNGYAYQRIKDLFEQDEFSREVSGLEVYLSIDGDEEIHEKQRGVKGAYKNLMMTLSFLLKKGVAVKLKMTITKYNYKSIIKVYEHCRHINVPFYIKLAEDETSNYYHRSKDFRGSFMFNPSYKNEIIASLKQIVSNEIYHEKPIVNCYYINLLVEYLNNNLSYYCLTPKYYLFVSCNGNIYPCLYNKPIGNIFENNWQLNINKPLYEETIVKAISGKCRHCLAYHGFIRMWNIPKKELFLPSD